MADLIQSAVPGMFSFGLEMALRASAILAGSLLLSFLLRRSSAALRHALWSVTLLALLALPAISAFGPTLAVAVPAAWVAGVESRGVDSFTEPAIAEATPVAPPGQGGASSGVLVEPWQDPGFGSSLVATSAGSETSTEPNRVVRARAPLDALQVGKFTLVLLWLGGQMLTVALMALGLRRARRALAMSVPVADAAWLRELRRAQQRVEVSRAVHLRISSAVSTPMTGGFRRPFILIPECAHQWTAHRRELVLLHEMIHVKRMDATRQLLGRLAASLYWFNPLVWLATRLSILAREQACDEAIIVMGHRPSTYARHLLELAAPTSLPLPALSMPRRPQLEKRLMSILKTKSPPRPGVVFCTGLGAALWALTVAAAVPSAAWTEDASRSEAPVATTGAVPTALTAIEAGLDFLNPIETVAEVAMATAVLPSSNGAQTQVRTCFDRMSGSFSGTISTSPSLSDDHAVERVRFANGDRVIQKRTEDGAMCLWGHGTVDFGEGLDEIAYISDGGWVVMAERIGGQVLRLEIQPGTEGFEYHWSIDGTPRDFE